MFMLCIVLAMRSWVDVDPSEEPQYQYPEQPSSEQFEQQEQFEEGKYNMYLNIEWIMLVFMYLSCIFVTHVFIM